LVLALVGIVLTFGFFSCDDNDGFSLNKYWISMATVENPDSTPFFDFTTDGGKRMAVVASQYPTYSPKDGQRIIANYTLLSNETGKYDHQVRLNNSYNVLTKDIFAITPATQDSIGNDPINIFDIWVGGDYLNIEFVYFAHNKSHFINLVSDESKEYNDGKVHLEFRHNAFNDPQSVRVFGIVSFRLEPLRVADKESIDLVIHSKPYNSQVEKTYSLTYKFYKENEDKQDLEKSLGEYTADFE
jgi:hypothetical protein